MKKLIKKIDSLEDMKMLHVNFFMVYIRRERFFKEYNRFFVVEKIINSFTTCNDKDFKI